VITWDEMDDALLYVRISLDKYTSNKCWKPQPFPTPTMSQPCSSSTPRFSGDADSGNSSFWRSVDNARRRRVEERYAIWDLLDFRGWPLPVHLRLRNNYPQPVYGKWAEEDTTALDHHQGDDGHSPILRSRCCVIILPRRRGEL
jgi:hypothetical protein